jgi:UDP-N-acetylglucosamine transferase subunit ALG13
MSSVAPIRVAKSSVPFSDRAGQREPREPLVFVTLGTDHHPFDRLVRWVDGWLANGGCARARCLVQTGRSMKSELGESVDFLPYEEIQRAVGSAAVVVTHGGPGSIALSVTLGRRPIVVPRLQSLGEHVDDHQIAFARRLAARGTIELVQREEEFVAALERALASPPDAVAAREVPPPLEAVRRVERLVDSLFEPKSEDADGRR